MGDDREPARAARVSYEDGKERTLEQDLKLTRYLIEQGHWGPFEMVELKFRIKAPIFVARQWMRHRTANINEFSMRYADPTRISDDGSLIDYYLPDYVDDFTRTFMTKVMGEAAYKYSFLIEDDDIPKEVARMVLPVATYTQWVWKIDLRNLFHFLELRLDEHAQWEIRQYATVILGMLYENLPSLTRIWMEHTND
jgi:thymidylate synthase (FAD)